MTVDLGGTMLTRDSLCTVHERLPRRGIQGYETQADRVTCPDCQRILGHQVEHALAPRSLEPGRHTVQVEGVELIGGERFLVHAKVIP